MKERRFYQMLMVTGTVGLLVWICAIAFAVTLFTGGC